MVRHSPVTKENEIILSRSVLQHFDKHISNLNAFKHCTLPDSV